MMRVPPLPDWMPAVRWTPGLLYGLTGAVGLGVITVALVHVRRRRRLSPEAAERARRLHINAIGRMINGEIIDLLPTEGVATADSHTAPTVAAPTVVYAYEVGGVGYQATQALDLIDAQLDPASWTPGWPVEVKYDPANPGNSIVACESWSGLSPHPWRAAARTGAVN